LSGASFAFTSEVSTSATLEWLQLEHEKLWHRGHLQWHGLPTKIHKNLSIFSEVDGGNKQPGW
jgi:hypothetical protein